MIAASRTLQRFAPALILVAGAIMVGVLWFGAVSAILEHRAAARARIRNGHAKQGRFAAGEIRRELLVTDQSLRILEVEWERDPASFNFDDWRKRLLALSNGSLQIFRTDSAGIVRQSSRADLVGDDVISRDYFRHELLLPSDEQRVFVSSLIRGLKTNLWQINIARRLDTSNGSFAGVIVASLDADIFRSLADRLDLRAHGLLVVVDNNGSVRGLGNVSLLSGTLSIAGSPIFSRMAHADRGIWKEPRSARPCRPDHGVCYCSWLRAAGSGWRRATVCSGTGTGMAARRYRFHCGEHASGPCYGRGGVLGGAWSANSPHIGAARAGRSRSVEFGVASCRTAGAREGPATRSDSVRHERRNHDGRHRDAPSGLERAFSRVHRGAEEICA